MKNEQTVILKTFNGKNFQTPQIPRKMSPMQSNNYIRMNQSPKSPVREDRANKVNFTYNLKVLTESKKTINQKEKCFYYIIVPGNNSTLVKNCFNHRLNWKECPSSATSIFHFQ